MLSCLWDDVCPGSHRGSTSSSAAAGRPSNKFQSLITSLGSLGPACVLITPSGARDGLVSSSSTWSSPLLYCRCHDERSKQLQTHLIHSSVSLAPCSCSSSSSSPSAEQRAPSLNDTNEAVRKVKDELLSYLKKTRLRSSRMGSGLDSTMASTSWSRVSSVRFCLRLSRPATPRYTTASNLHQRSKQYNHRMRGLQSSECVGLLTEDVVRDTGWGSRACYIIE